MKWGTESKARLTRTGQVDTRRFALPNCQPRQPFIGRRSRIQRVLEGVYRQLGKHFERSVAPLREMTDVARTHSSRSHCSCSGSSLAYIGDASAMMRAEGRGADARRFRLGDKKEGAGAADAVIYLGPMGFE